MYKLLYLIHECPSVRPKMFIRITVVEVLLVFKNLRMPVQVLKSLSVGASL